MLKLGSPYFLILIPFILYLFLRKSKISAIKFPGISTLKKYQLKSKKYLLGKYLIMTSLLLMTLALSRPQLVSDNKLIKKQGIDITIVLDLSTSMLIEDFKPNRLEVAKQVLESFIAKRIDDRISLVVFGGDAYTKAPLTFDHTVISEIVKKLTVEDITSNNKTAIGMGLGVAINRLKESTTKSKIIILLTDGINNSGEMSPEGAAKIAKDLGIKIYTIGIGAREQRVMTLFGIQTIKNTDLDETLLEYIAKETEGQYFRAGNDKEFASIFETIDKLEKSDIQGRDFYQKDELYEGFLIIALFLLLLGILLNYLFYVRIP